MRTGIYALLAQETSRAFVVGKGLVPFRLRIKCGKIERCLIFPYLHPSLYSPTTEQVIVDAKNTHRCQGQGKFL